MSGDELSQLRGDNARLRTEVDQLRERIGALESVRITPREVSPRTWLRRPSVLAAVALAFGLGVVAYTTHEEAERARSLAFTAQSNAQNAINHVNQVQSRLSSLERRRTLGLGASPPTQATAEDFVLVERSGEVTEVSGEAPVEVGERCNLTLTAASRGRLNCRAVVRCGERLLYGKQGFGYLQCEIVDGSPTRGLDTNGSASGDPKFRLALPDDRIVVSDGPDPEMSVTIDLE